MPAGDPQTRTFSLLLRIRLVIEAVLGVGLIALGAPVLLRGSGRDVVQSIGWILIFAAFFFPIARSLSFLLLAGIGSLRLRQNPKRPPSLILLATALDLPVSLAFALSSGLLPWAGILSSGLAVVLLLWDVVLLVLTVRRLPARSTESAAARPSSFVLRLAPVLANAMCVLFLVRFVTAVTQVAPPHELRIDKSSDVAAVPKMAPSIQSPLVDEDAVWSLHSGMGSTELARVDLQRYQMQYRFPLPPEIAQSSTEFRGALRHPNGDRLLLIYKSQTDDLFVLAARPEGGIRTVLSLGSPARWEPKPPDSGSRSERLVIMGWSLTNEKFEFITQKGLHIEYAMSAATRSPSSVRRVVGCEGSFDEVRWAARERNGWRLLIEKQSERQWIVVGPEGTHPLDGSSDHSELRIDLSPGNIMNSSSLPARFEFRGDKLVEIKPMPPVPSNYVASKGLSTLDAQGLHYAPAFCKERLPPCMLPTGTDWIHVDRGSDGLRLASDPTRPGELVAPRQVSAVFVPHLVTWQDRAWLIMHTDPYVIALRKPLKLVPLGLLERLQRIVPTDEESLRLKVRWMGAKAGGWEGVDSLGSAVMWNIIKYLPLALGPLFTLLFLLLRRDPRAHRLLQLTALCYLMLCVIAGPLLFYDLESF